MTDNAHANLLNDYLKRILNAKVYDVAKQTSLDDMPKLSTRLQCNVLLKREDQQPVFSFKIRGAYNKISQLPTEALQKGVITASAGNHAQGVALSASHLGIPSIIVMPETTPDIKITAVENFGGTVVKHGVNFDQANTYAKELAAEKGLTFTPPFDDVDVIAGQGTIGLEILRQTTADIDAVFIPVGGGGLIAGVGVAIKALRPEIKIIGVEPEDAASMKESLDKQTRITLDEVGIFADGVAVKQIGEENFQVASQVVDLMLTVTTDEICAAIKDIYDDTRAIAEPAGAVAIAGLKKYQQTLAKDKSQQTDNSTFVAINSGANVNFDRLKHISERADIGEHKEALFAARIPEKKQSFLAFCETIGNRNITEFNYRFADKAEADIFVGVQLRNGKQEQVEVMTELQDAGIKVIDLSDNELAKLHLRHMVGGHTVLDEKEHLFRFQFPEHPSALLNFLRGLGDWNISLFHYRNHGAAYGRVLVGIQAADSELASLNEHLTNIGYRYWPETDNPAYNMFLNDNSL